MRALVVALRAAGDQAWRVLLPIEVTGADGATWTRDVDVRLPAGQAAAVSLPLPAGARPARVRVDPDLDVVRRLSPAELPVSLRRVMGAARKRVVLPDPSAPLAPAYRALAPDLAARLGATLVEADQATLDDGAVVLGATGRLARALAARLAAQGMRADATGPLAVPGAEVPGAGACLVACAQVEGDGVAALIVARSPAALQAALKLVHYGREGRVLFDAGRAVGRGRADPAGDGPLSRAVD